ncbi:SRPBCC family protein, partial [Actinomycetospora lutea]|uniref:SRPBCC family protein n=1 Tax=Actinomycetospora lutea TaxID=663604 RepID=UPI0023655A12
TASMLADITLKIQETRPSPGDFAAFAAPGYVKIVLSVRAVPQGPDAAVLTVETRVAATDAASARRFRRYWRAIGPFSELIRRIALGMLTRELDPPARNSGEILIGRPAETVFDAVADERTEPRYNPQVRGVELLTPEPLGVGTRFRAEAGSAAMTIEITGYDRPRRFDSTTRMGAMDIDYTLTFEPVEAGTRMHWLFELHLRGALRALRPAVEALGRRQERRNWALLRRYLESRSGALMVPNDADREFRQTPCLTGPTNSGAFGFVSSVPIRRSQADVFAFLSEVQDSEPIPRRARVRMVKEPDGPTTVGTRWHEQVRLLPGCWLHVRSVVTEVEEPVRLGMDFSSCWFAGHTVYEMTPTTGGCVLRHREVIRPRPWMSVAVGLLGRSRRRHVAERLQDIKAVLETQRPTPGS